jgi:hypothetical protein
VPIGKKHVDQLVSKGSFQNYYRMKEQSYDRLVSLLDPYLKGDDTMAIVKTGTEAVPTYIKLHCFLRYCAGGDHSDIRIIAGVSKPSFYRCVYETASAIIKIDQLKLKFPSSIEEMRNSSYCLKLLG